MPAVRDPVTGCVERVTTRPLRCMACHSLPANRSRLCKSFPTFCSKSSLKFASESTWQVSQSFRLCNNHFAAVQFDRVWRSSGRMRPDVRALPLPRDPAWSGDLNRPGLRPRRERMCLPAKVRPRLFSAAISASGSFQLLVAQPSRRFARFLNG